MRFIFPRAMRVLVATVMIGVGIDSQAAVIKVGSVGGCDYTNLDDAFGNLPDNIPNTIQLSVGTYTNEHGTIDGRMVTIIGSFADCSATSPQSGAAYSIISGAGHTGDSVLTIKGTSHVVLQNIEITHGNENSGDGHGGGIDFTGHGTLDLTNTLIYDNYAKFGGGINVDSDGSLVTVTLHDNTSILFNTAGRSGGGLRLYGDAELDATGTNVYIGNNEAVGINDSGQPQDGYGGGLEVVDRAVAYLASTTVSYNQARFGGGISVTADGLDSSHPARVQLYSNSGAPTRLSHNIASVTGGAVQIEPNDSITPILCAIDFRLDANTAPDGAAIYSHTDSGVGGQLALHRDDAAFCANTHNTRGGIPCSAGVACNRIDGNIAQDTDGNRTSGAIIQFRPGFPYSTTINDFVIDHTTIIGNVGGSVLEIDEDDGANEKITNCLIANNTVSGALIVTDDNTPIDFENCTFGNNTIGGGSVFAISDDFTLINSIIWQPQPLKTSFAQNSGSGTKTIHDVLASETASLGGDQTIRYGDPRFVDPDNGDFHLQPASLAVDASTTIPSGFDLDNNNRNVELALVPNFRGAGDLGAYEVQSIGNLVRNPGFDTDLRIWTENTTGMDSLGTPFVGYSSNYDRISVQPALPGTHVGLSQCVWIPGPGEYQLTASGASVNSLDTNTASLHWAYIAGTDDTCAGPALSQGDVNFPNEFGYYLQSMDAPVLINVPANAWGHSSAVLIQLSVTSNSITDPTHAITAGGFDDISLTPAVDEIFKNGFEAPSP